jgi:Zn-dependent peptidase ImmA (M78 family)/DNA-binding XRE family transcriptional regulator
MTRGRGHVQLPMFGSGSSEFRERVKRLRQLRRWDQSKLAKEAGTSATAISQIETGRVAPTNEQIDDIASALGYSPRFLTAELNLLPTTRPWLRAYADASRREADARTAAATVAAEYVRSIGLTPLPDLIPPFMGDIDDEDAIDEAAGELRHLAEIDRDAVVTNTLRAAERVGCVVLPLESELGRHLGMSVRSDQMPIICVAKSDVPGDRQRWTVAHELGHLALHGQAPPPRDNNEAARMERQAHRFAAAFLGPGDALIETLDQCGGRVTLRALAEVKAIWGIAIKALVGRYHSLGVIDADHARSLYKQLSARKWSKAEPVNVPIESAQWFQRTLLRKAETDDLAIASRRLADAVGGNAHDLYEFANWAPRPEAQILSLVARQRRSS